MARPKYVLSPKAEQDLRDIWHNIAPHNERAAGDLLIRILERLSLLPVNRSWARRVPN